MTVGTLVVTPIGTVLTAGPVEAHDSMLSVLYQEWVVWDDHYSNQCSLVHRLAMGDEFEDSNEYSCLMEVIVITLFTSCQRWERGPSK